MAGIITTSSFAKALYPGVNAWYGKAYDEYPTEYTSLVDVENSSRAYEEDVGISSFGLASVKGEGGAISYDDEHQSFLTRYSHVVWGKGFVITREMYEDDQYSVKAQNLAFAMRQTKEVVVANVYNRAFNSSYTGGDGSELCASDHANWAGGTWSNYTNVDLSEAALEQAVINIAKWENDRGLRIAVIPKKLIIPVDLQFEAKRLLYSEYRPDTANNDINAMYAMKAIPDGMVVNHYLTNTDDWFLRTNAPHGLKLFQRRGMEFTIDNDFDTENAKFKATERYSVGWTDPRGIYGSEGA
jgi:hypothetical protein